LKFKVFIWAIILYSHCLFNMNNLQFLINFVGYSIILQYFAAFLGRKNCKIFIRDESVRSTRTLQVPKNFTGLGFDGVHWKGYENGKMVYESYSKGVQLKGTNNYCQSYACFMWASGNLRNDRHGVNLEAGKYTDNIMKISSLWVKCLRSLNKKQKARVTKCIYDIDKTMKLKDLLGILEKLSVDESYAMELSCSRESLF